jgi:hypothetical protein
MRFATYLHPQTFSTSKLLQEISFTGASFTYYNQVRHTLKNYLKNYPALPLRKARISDYLRVHSREYLQKIILQAVDRPLDEISISLPELSIECQGLEYGSDRPNETGKPRTRLLLQYGWASRSY